MSREVHLRVDEKVVPNRRQEVPAAAELGNDRQDDIVDINAAEFFDPEEYKIRRHELGQADYES
jgi:hypothetical protein